ncbi:calmodulin-binding protein [Streptosporangium sp. NPDC051022]|uniref:BP74-related protein n=1 Tax=Streptosporangium sp. NPDC051022 TaxID=3155752 RepID=UPI0034454C28
MKRVLSGVAALAAVATLGLAVPAQARQADPAPQAALGPAAYFEFTDSGNAKFVFKLTDPTKIQHARDLLNGATTAKPSVMGKIAVGTASYNPAWSYHYIPSTVQFFEGATEVCDAGIAYVEEHLSEVGGSFLPGNAWCPWSSRLVREVSAP